MKKKEDSWKRQSELVKRASPLRLFLNLNGVCLRNKIEEWLKDPTKAEDKDGVNISTRNAYQRRLIYQEVRKRCADDKSRQ